MVQQQVAPESLSILLGSEAHGWIVKHMVGISSSVH